MSNISWVEAVPSDTSRVADYPSFARSIWTAITTGLSTSLYWDASGGASSASAGGLRPGASRAYFDVASRSSVPSQGTARAFLCSDTSRLYVYESVATYLAGTPFLEEFATLPAPGAVLTMQSGSSFVNVPGSSGFTFTQTFPTPFVATPQIFLTYLDPAGAVAARRYTLITSSSTTNFSSVITGNVAPSTGTFFWTAIGSTLSYT